MATTECKSHSEKNLRFLPMGHQDFLDLNEQEDRTITQKLGNSLLKHNGLSISDYADSRWKLVPFPEKKGDIFNADNLATVNSAAFLRQTEYQSAKTHADSRWTTGYRDVSWRLHVALWVASSALILRRSCSFLELGVGKGYMAAGICDYLKNRSHLAHPQRFTLVDSFLSNPDELFFYSTDFEEVAQYFSKYPFVEVVKGEVPEILDSCELSEVGFCHIDMNDAESELKALSVLRERIAGPCFLLFDDTGNPGCERQLEAHQSFANDVGSDLMLLPTGQALCVLGEQCSR